MSSSNGSVTSTNEKSAWRFRGRLLEPEDTGTSAESRKCQRSVPKFIELSRNTITTTAAT